MRKIEVILIVLLAFYNSLNCQWLDKNDHQVLSEKVANLMDFKIFPEQNLIIAIDKDNQIYKWEYDSGKLIESKKVKSGINSNAFISRDGLTTIITETKTFKYDSIYFIASVFSNNNLSMIQDYFYKIDNYLRKINYTNFADYNFMKKQILLVVDHFFIQQMKFAFIMKM